MRTDNQCIRISISGKLISEESCMKNPPSRMLNVILTNDG